MRKLKFTKYRRSIDFWQLLDFEIDYRHDICHNCSCFYYNNYSNWNNTCHGNLLWNNLNKKLKINVVPTIYEKYKPVSYLSSSLYNCSQHSHEENGIGDHTYKRLSNNSDKFGSYLIIGKKLK